MTPNRVAEISTLQKQGLVQTKLDKNQISSFRTFVLFWMLHAFFWIILRRLNFICRRFGTLCSIFTGR